jgi:hypothetical protein
MLVRLRRKQRGFGGLGIVNEDHLVPPWEWRKRNSDSRQTLFLDVAALGFSLRSPQRDAKRGV